MATKAKEVKIPEDVERGMLRAAVGILGEGYTPDYYDQMIVSELRWAYRLGYEAGRASKERKK
jgi:hypothetical protein